MRAATMDPYIITQVLMATDIATVIAGCPGYGVKQRRLFVNTTSVSEYRRLHVSRCSLA